MLSTRTVRLLGKAIPVSQDGAGRYTGVYNTSNGEDIVHVTVTILAKERAFSTPRRTEDGKEAPVCATKRVCAMR